MRESIFIILLQLYTILGSNFQETTEIIPVMSVERLKDFDEYGLIYDVPKTYPSARRFSSNGDVTAMSVNRFMLAVMRAVKTYSDEDIMNIIRAVKKSVKQYKQTHKYVFGFDKEQQAYLKIIENINANTVRESLRQNEYWFLHEMGKHDKLIILDSSMMRKIAAKSLKLLEDLNTYSDYLKRTDQLLEEISRNCIGVALDLSKYSISEVAAKSFNTTSSYFFNAQRITTLDGNLKDISIEALKKIDKLKLLKKRLRDDVTEIDIKEYYKALHNIFLSYERQDLVDNIISLATSLSMLALSNQHIPIDMIYREAQTEANEKNLVLLLDSVENRNLAANIMKLLDMLTKYKDKRQRKIFENVDIVDCIYKSNADILKYAVPAVYAQAKRRLDDSLYNLNIMKAMDIYKVIGEPNVTSVVNSEQSTKITEEQASVERLKDSDEYGLIYEVPNTYPCTKNFTLNSTVPAMSINHFVLAVIRAIKGFKNEDILSILRTVKKISKQYGETVKYFSVSGIDEDQKKYLKVIEDLNPVIVLEALRQNECRFLYEMSTKDKLLILDSPTVRQIVVKSLRLLENLKSYNKSLKRIDSKLEEISMNCIGVALDLSKYSVNESAANNANSSKLTTFLGGLRNISIQELIKLDKFKLLRKYYERKRLRRDVAELNLNDYYKTLRSILSTYEYVDLVDNILCIASAHSSVSSDTSDSSTIDLIINKAQKIAEEKKLVLLLDTVRNINLAANIINALHMLIEYKDKKGRKIFENGEIIDNLFQINADLSKYAVPAVFPQAKRRFEDSQYGIKMLKDMDFYNLIHEPSTKNGTHSKPPVIRAKDFCVAIIKELKSYEESDLKDVLMTTELILNRLKNSTKSKVGYVWNKLMNAVTSMKVIPLIDLKKYLDVLEKQVQDEDENILKLDTLEERILAKQMLKFLNDLTAYNNKMEGNVQLRNIIGDGLILVSDFRALSYDAHTYFNVLGALEQLH